MDSLLSEVTTSPHSFGLSDGIRLAASRAQKTVNSAPTSSGLLIYGEDGKEENDGCIRFDASEDTMEDISSSSSSISRTSSNGVDDDDRRNDILYSSHFTNSTPDANYETSALTPANTERHGVHYEQQTINKLPSSKGHQNQRESFAGAVFEERRPDGSVSGRPQAHLTLIALHSSITLQGPCYVYGMGGETSLGGYFIGSGGMYLPTPSHRVCVVPMGKRIKKKGKCTKGPLEHGAHLHYQKQQEIMQRDDNGHKYNDNNDSDKCEEEDKVVVGMTNNGSLTNNKVQKTSASTPMTSEDIAHAISFGEVDWGWVVERLEAWKLRFGHSAPISILLVLTRSNGHRLQWFEDGSDQKDSERLPRDLPGFISRTALPRMEPAIMDVIHKIVFAPLRSVTTSLLSMPRVMIVGEANVGKTTLATTLANGFISRHGVCYWLDMDLGQPLQYLGKNHGSGHPAGNTPDNNTNMNSSLVHGPLPSCMTLLRIQKPITAVVGGLCCAKPPPLEPRDGVVTVIHQIYLGTNTAMCPHATAAAVKAITEVAEAYSTGKKFHQSSSVPLLSSDLSPSRLSTGNGGPLVVNTHGWVQSTGRRVTIEAFQRLKPTHLLHLCQVKEDTGRHGGDGRNNRNTQTNSYRNSRKIDNTDFSGVDKWSTETVLCNPANGFNSHTLRSGRSAEGDGFRRHFGFDSLFPPPSVDFSDVVEPQRQVHDDNVQFRQNKKKPKESTHIAKLPPFRVLEVDIIAKPATQLKREATRNKLRQPREGMMQMKRRIMEEMESQDYEACDDDDGALLNKETGTVLDIDTADCVVYRFHVTRDKKATMTWKPGPSSTSTAGQVSNSAIRRNMWFQHFFPCFSAHRGRHSNDENNEDNDSNNDETVSHPSRLGKVVGFGGGRINSSGKVHQVHKEGYCMLQLCLSHFCEDKSSQCASKHMSLSINRIILAGVDETCLALYNKQALGAILRHSMVAIAVVTVTPTLKRPSYDKNLSTGNSTGHEIPVEVSLLSNISRPIRGTSPNGQLGGHHVTLGFPRVIAFACVIDVIEEMMAEKQTEGEQERNIEGLCIQGNNSIVKVDLILPLPPQYNSDNDNPHGGSSSELIKDYILHQRQQGFTQEGCHNEICLVVGLGDTKDTADVMGRCCDIFS